MSGRSRSSRNRLHLPLLALAIGIPRHTYFSTYSVAIVCLTLPRRLLNLDQICNINVLVLAQRSCWVKAFRCDFSFILGRRITSPGRISNPANHTTTKIQCCVDRFPLLFRVRLSIFALSFPALYCATSRCIFILHRIKDRCGFVFDDGMDPANHKIPWFG